MKVLILSCSTGGGHNSAAIAICEKFKELKVECLMIDSIELTSKSFSKKVNQFYIDVVNNVPNLFKKAYHMAELYGKLKIKSPVYGVNVLFAKNLREFIEVNDFDVIIATHLYPAETLTTIKKKKPNMHFIVVATDYVSIPFWQETNPDYFIIPSKKLKQEFVEKGINSKKILSFGIPVSPKFNNHFTKVNACRQLSLPCNKKIVLIMSGSMGFGNIEEIIDRILNDYRDNIHIVAITGNNEIYKNKLQKLYPNKNITIVGFTNDVNIYMDACDVILTKPGGLTSTETAVKNVPTIFTNPIPGCENYNASFLQEYRMAFSSDSIDDLMKYLSILLENKKTINLFKKNQSKYINKNAVDDICKFIIKGYNH
ncbi:MAG TPA: glycosyltransferase [Bacilli bacterium]|nr:glycosyltransferase [Bacilli bacterium]